MRGRRVSVGAPSGGDKRAPGRAAHTWLALPYRVRFDESTPAGAVRTSALLRYAQDSAWAHSERLGFGRDWYAERGLFWLVRAVELHILGTLWTGATASVTTTVRGFRRVLARRRTAIDGPDGSPVAVIDTDWAMVDETGAPRRIPVEFPALLGPEPATFTANRVALPPAPEDAAIVRFSPRRHELDPMGHANNAAYLDWLEEAVVLATPALLAAVPRAYRLEYLLPAGPEARLAGRAWPTGASAVAYRLSDGVVELLRGTLEA